MNIQLKTGKTISVSTYDYYFKLQDDEVEAWFESCVADDQGVMIENPFSGRGYNTKPEVEDYSELPELPELPEDFENLK